MAEPMPTEQDYARAREALSRAFDELDGICFQFAKNIGDDFEEIQNPSLDPSLADIGALYSFTSDVRWQILDLERFTSKLTSYLEILDGLRLDLEAARRCAVAA